jgi:transcriptional regulator with XRE-family HTH domain
VPASDEVKHRAELAEFLRAKRAGLKPTDVGIVGGLRRRVPGLRRHEVADLAGVSDTWYTWLEQGRDMRISPEMLDAVCRALRLDEEEHVYVRRLVGRPMMEPSEDSEITAERLDALRGVLDDLLPSAAHIATASWDLLAWNSTYAALFGDPELLPPQHRNHLWKFFMTDETRTRLVDWELEASRAVARFRAEEAWFNDDGRLKAMVDELLGSSEEFRRAWENREVARFVGYTERINHPDVGEIQAHLIRMTIVEQPPLVMFVHRPVDDESRKRMAVLAGSVAS